MEIIFVCTKSITFNTFLKSQAIYLSKKGFKVKVACSDIENLNFKNKLNHTIDFPTKYTDLINIFKYVKIFLQIKELIKKNKTSIFYLHTPAASHLFRLFAIFYRLKIVYFVHGFRFTSKTNFLRSIFFKVIEKILSLKTNVFITINNEDFYYTKHNLFTKVPTYKINGVGLDLDKKKSNFIFKKKSKIYKILVIAAYKKSKGYIDLLKIADLLKKRDFKIECYGYGDYEKFKSIKIKKKINNISFKKFDVNLKAKIKNYDILLHLSKREGLPVSVMECLAQGLPVICNKIRGNSDLIKDGFNGFFVNSYKDVPNKIFYLSLEKEIFNRMRNNSINSITKNFSKEKINQTIYRIIKENFRASK
jgi:glycosyltransferase involved in cell wall biosynthesis